MNSKRVFLAINLPEEVKEAIEYAFLKKLPKEGLKPVEKENLHVTLFFIGYVTESHIEKLKRILSKLSEFKQFEATLKGIGCFGSRVLWLGVQKNAEKIVELNKSICNLLNVKDERFVAHVTLARNKTLKYASFMELVETLKKVEFEKSFNVKSVDIMESILTSKGPIYKKLAEIKLASA